MTTRLAACRAQPPAVEPPASERARDRDHDVIADVRDPCPEAPETYSAIDDEDGCPDAASDRGEERLEAPVVDG